MLPGGGQSHWKGVLGCAAVMSDPLFSGQSPLPSLPIYCQCVLLWPPFSIFRKFLNFQPNFGQNFSSLDPNFSKSSFPRHPFFKENPLPRPYILKPAWHTSTKKKLSAPSSPPGELLCKELWSMEDKKRNTLEDRCIATHLFYLHYAWLIHLWTLFERTNSIYKSHQSSHGSHSSAITGVFLIPERCFWCLWYAYKSILYCIITATFLGLKHGWLNSM